MNTNNRPYFGVAGFPPSFFESYKKREMVFEWLAGLGLDWIELQNTYGVKMKDEQASLYRSLAEKHKIKLSIHAPYYINLASARDEVVERSKDNIVKCFELAVKIGAERVIFHPGHFPGSTEDDRKAAVDKIISGLNALKPLLPTDEVFIYPETAGKCKQIGSVEEIITICENVDYARPCIDMAHVHGFEGGILTSAAAIVKVFDKIEDSLGDKGLKDAHFHVYPVEINIHGEKKHCAFGDTLDGVPFYPLAEDFITAVKGKKLTPVIICEARDSQDSGALLMKKLYGS